MSNEKNLKHKHVDPRASRSTTTINSIFNCLIAMWEANYSSDPILAKIDSFPDFVLTVEILAVVENISFDSKCNLVTSKSSVLG